MAEVQNAAQTLLLFIFLHHFLFEVQGVGNDPDQPGRRLSGSQGIQFRFKIEGFKAGKSFLIKTERHFHRLGQAVGDLAAGQGGKGGRIHQDAARLIKCADNVLDSIQVDGGFAADGGVHLGKDGGGNVVEINAAHIAGRGETGQIADHAAADGSHAVPAAHAQGQHAAEQQAVIVKALAGFPFGNPDHLRSQGGCGNGIRIGFGHTGVRDHQNLPVQVQQGTRVAQTAGFQHDIITVFTKRQGDRFAVHRYPSLTETIYPGAGDVNVSSGIQRFSFCFSNCAD